MLKLTCCTPNCSNPATIRIAKPNEIYITVSCGECEGEMRGENDTVQPLFKAETGQGDTNGILADTQ